MTRSYCPSRCLTGKLAATALVLGLFSIDSYGDEATRTDVGSNERPSTSQSSGSTSVNRELQKLFEASGQKMPSMRTSDLPYTTTPRMDRVRKRQAKSATPSRTKGILSKVFGRFRREKREHDAHGPEGRPNVAKKEVPLTGQRNQHRNAVVRPVEPQQQRVVVTSEPVSVRPSRAATVRRGRPRGEIRPASQAQDSVVTSSKDVDADEQSADEFVNPFEDADAFPDGDSVLDLEAVGEIPDVAEEALFQEPEPEHQEEVGQPSSDSELNPFSGMRIDAAGEFINPFEEPDADAEDDESMAVDPDQTAVPLVRDVATEEPTYVESENDQSDAEPNPFASESLDWAEFERTPTTAPAKQPPAHPLITNVATTAESRIASVSRSRRLAPIDRVPVERAQAERWRESEKPAVDTSDDDRAFSDYIASKSVPQKPRNTFQDTRRQKIQARRHLSGFMGFCPVELRESRDLVDAVKTYEARFGLHTYRFSSEEALQQFNENPTRYAPVAGGADVVALVNSGEHHAGSLEFAMWYRDRLYLFGSRETMKLFGKDPASFADEY